MAKVEMAIFHIRWRYEKAKNLLNYNPKYSFKEGLKESIKWYWDNLK
jgi:nucleoside-diphosphate-sugar epimerase